MLPCAIPRALGARGAAPGPALQCVLCPAPAPTPARRCRCRRRPRRATHLARTHTLWNVEHYTRGSASPACIVPVAPSTACPAALSRRSVGACNLTLKPLAGSRDGLARPPPANLHPRRSAAAPAGPSSPQHGPRPLHAKRGGRDCAAARGATTRPHAPCLLAAAPGGRRCASACERAVQVLEGLSAQQVLGWQAAGGMPRLPARELAAQRAARLTPL